jgi:hypothetical protein
MKDETIFLAGHCRGMMMERLHRNFIQDIGGLIIIFYGSFDSC